MLHNPYKTAMLPIRQFNLICRNICRCSPVDPSQPLWAVPWIPSFQPKRCREIAECYGNVISLNCFTEAASAALKLPNPEQDYRCLKAMQKGLKNAKLLMERVYNCGDLAKWGANPEKIDALLSDLDDLVGPLPPVPGLEE